MPAPAGSGHATSEEVVRFDPQLPLATAAQSVVSPDHPKSHDEILYDVCREFYDTYCPRLTARLVSICELADIMGANAAYDCG